MFFSNRIFSNENFVSDATSKQTISKQARVSCGRERKNNRKMFHHVHFKIEKDYYELF